MIVVVNCSAVDMTDEFRNFRYDVDLYDCSSVGWYTQCSRDWCRAGFEKSRAWIGVDCRGWVCCHRTPGASNKTSVPCSGGYHEFRLAAPQPPQWPPTVNFGAQIRCAVKSRSAASLQAVASFLAVCVLDITTSRRHAVCCNCECTTSPTKRGYNDAQQRSVVHRSLPAVPCSGGGRCTPTGQYDEPMDHGHHKQGLAVVQPKVGYCRLTAAIERAVRRVEEGLATIFHTR